MSNIIDRRTLLQGGGALVVSFALPLSLADATRVVGPKIVSSDRVDGFLAIAPDGGITIYSGKVDLGTGVRTALTQIVAEELDVPMIHVSLIEGDTALTPDQGVTSGSLSIQNGGMQLRRAAATARRAILQKAAARLRRDIASLSIHKGTITAGDGRRLPIGEFVDRATLAIEIANDVREKSPSAYTIVGEPVARLDIPDKVSGRFTFMQDFKLPGMLHGRVVRPSGFGATLISYDEASIAHIPGIVKVVRIHNFLGVVANSEWGAIRGAQQLAVTWSKQESLPEQSRIWEHVRSTPVVHDDVTSRIGDSRAALDDTLHKLSATYDFAIHTHGSIGPSCAVAEFTDGKLTCWTASRFPMPMCAAFMSKGRAATAGTDTRMPRPTQPCSRAR